MNNMNLYTTGLSSDAEAGCGPPFDFSQYNLPPPPQERAPFPPHGDVIGRYVSWALWIVASVKHKYLNRVIYL